MGNWVIGVSKLAYNFNIMEHWLLHVLKLAYNLGNYHEIVGNALIVTSFRIHFSGNEFSVSLAVCLHNYRIFKGLGRGNHLKSSA